jgi:deoxyribodipyrimidine photo-lyase
MGGRKSTQRVPAIRVAACNDADPRPDADFVLHWMTAARRTTWNFSLERAVEWARELSKPLVVVETLASGRRWDSDRHHAFALGGMAENRAACEAHGVRYYPFVETEPGAALDLVAALADRACTVVSDDYPIRECADDAAALAARVNVAVERVDSNGLLPLRAADRAFPTAYAFRRFLHRALPDHLTEFPRQNPLARISLPKLRGLPRAITSRWAPAPAKLLSAEPAALARLPIDHEVSPADLPGGPAAARKALRRFLGSKVQGYADERNHPAADVTSGLSPYLHFGHVATHEIFHELAKAEGWSPTRLADKPTGKREGWWGMSPAAEAFLDELITWREVGFNMCAQTADYDEYESLPDWALTTLADHADDPRPELYSLEELERGSTHDALWNAAQAEIVRTGRMHNYLRMLWGKKLLEWSPSPREALAAMIELNNKYGLDGRDPNSYSGIFWVLGRYDRPWGPERPIFGKVRYMSSENTVRKLRLGDYLDAFAPAEQHA